MSSVAKGIGQIAGVAAAVLQFIPGGQPFAAAAAAISTGAGAIAQLTAKPPTPPEQLQEYTFGSDQPIIMGLGRSYLPGQLVHHEAHGREREDIPNPWYTQTFVLSLGPVDAIEQQYADKSPINFSVTTQEETGYYDKYLRGDSQLGAVPETTALSWDAAGAPNFDLWSNAHFISSFAAVQYGMLLDSEETHYRSGPPEFGSVGRWSKHYDPRKDDTYPGGVGTHRIDDISTHEYSTNGPIQALNYFYGHWRAGKLFMGAGMPITSIDVESFVAAANYAEANNWQSHGFIVENGEDGEIANNAGLMLETASAWFSIIKGKIVCFQRRPLVTVDTIRSEDLIGRSSIKGMRGYDEGFNQLTPSIISEDNNWTKVPLTKVSVDTLVTSMGEERPRTHDFTLVKDPTQAAQLSALMIYDSVEIDPISLTVGPRFIRYEVGDAFDTDIPELGLVGQPVILLRNPLDLKTGSVVLGLKTETPAKHPFALGQTDTAPPQPTLATPEQYEAAERELFLGPLRSSSISGSSVIGMASAITLAEQGDTTWTVTIPAHSRQYINPEIFPTVTVDAGTVTGIASPATATTYYIIYDDVRLEGGAVTYSVTANASEAIVSQTNPYRHRVAAITIPASGNVAPPAQPTPPPGIDDGWDGEGPIP